MQLEVRLFGGLAERAGTSRTTVELADDATVAELRAVVANAHPRLAGLLDRVNVAVDLEVARDTAALAGAREIALLPPVAGGAERSEHARRPRTAGGAERSEHARRPRTAGGAERSEHARRPRTAGGAERGEHARRPRTAGGADEAVVVTGLAAPPLDLAGTLERITGARAGGTAVFLGTVRDHAPDLDRVVTLEYSAYEAMAEKVLADLADQLLADHPTVLGLALVHSVGDLAVGDHTILIAAAAAHRDPAFDACRDALERVKDQVPIFKREVTADGAHRWVGLPPPAAP